MRPRKLVQPQDAATDPQIMRPQLELGTLWEQRGPIIAISVSGACLHRFPAALTALLIIRGWARAIMNSRSIRRGRLSKFSPETQFLPW